jgi:hypothetical protein
MVQRSLGGWLRLAFAALLASLLVGVAGTGVAWATGPLLDLSSVANTTVAPGATLDYFIQARNDGDTATDGSEVLTITLPPHATIANLLNFTMSCSPSDGSPDVVGATAIQCTSFGPQSPGGFYFMILTAQFDDAASGVLSSRLSITGGGAPSATIEDPTTVSPTPPGFGVDGFDAGLKADATGTPLTQAGGHPYALTTAFGLNTMTNPQLVATTPEYNQFTGDLFPAEPLKDAVVDLPPGVIGDPSSVTQCSLADLSNSLSIDTEPLCAPSSQVGGARLRMNAFGFFGEAPRAVPVFNMVPPPGVPARFGFNAFGIIVTMDARVRSDGDYGLSVNVRNIPEGLAIAGTTVTFWGVPADHAHDFERWCPRGTPAPCSAGIPAKAFLRNATYCPPAGTGLTTSLHVDSWFNPAPFNADGSPVLSDSGWKSASSIIQLPTGCEKVPFDPTLDARPIGQARASTPTPFQFDLKLPQSSDPNVIAEGDLRTAVVTLPQGVHVSPSSANGLDACTPAQIGLLGTGFPEPNTIRFSTADPTCPDASKLGTVKIDTPLLPDPLTGSVYLASPNNNPFNTLLAIYLVAQGDGITIKLPGKITTSSSGQLTATFDDAPQTPFTDLQLSFFGGPQGALVLPEACGTYTTNAVLTSWSGKRVTSDSSFTVDHESDGSACGGPTFNPSFTAGTINPVAGAETPFVLALGRSDRDRQLGAVAVDMPSGLLGKIANTVLCPDGPANAGTCQDVSKVGNVTVDAGAGDDPFEISTGRAYITGPYKGAPFGLSIVVPAVAGPFNLGDVVVRSALFVDRHTAALKVVSDPFPTILDGIRLDLRAVRVLIDKPHFIVNPTNCAERRIFGTVTSADGVVVHTSERFRVTDCASLPFAPKMTISVGGRGHTRAGVSTRLTTTLTQTPGQAHLRSVTVTLPSSLNALLAVLNRACTQAQFDAGHCRGARAGSAVAVTPLLRDPLRGSAFFVRSPHRLLPDLVVALRGQVDVDLIGKVGVNPQTNQLTTRFDTIPDVAIKKFVLRLVAGANGPLGTTTNLCSAKARRATASIGFRAQNGKVLSVHRRLRVLGCGRTR